MERRDGTADRRSDRIGRPVLALAPSRDENEMVVTALEDPPANAAVPHAGERLGPARPSVGAGKRGQTLRIAGYLIKSAPEGDFGSPMRSETLSPCCRDTAR